MENIKLIGSKFTKLNAERKQNFTGKLTLNTNIKIKDLEKMGELKDALKISYDFEVNYGDLGGVIIEGNLFISTNSKTIKELLKSWKDKKFDTPEHLQITNFIIQKASIKAFELEEELQLPIHIRLPTLIQKKINLLNFYLITHFLIPTILSILISISTPFSFKIESNELNVFHS